MTVFSAPPKLKVAIGSCFQSEREMVKCICGTVKVGNKWYISEGFCSKDCFEKDRHTCERCGEVTLNPHNQKGNVCAGCLEKQIEGDDYSGPIKCVVCKKTALGNPWGSDTCYNCADDLEILGKKMSKTLQYSLKEGEGDQELWEKVGEFFELMFPDMDVGTIECLVFNQDY